MNTLLKSHLFKGFSKLVNLNSLSKNGKVALNNSLKADKFEGTGLSIELTSSLKNLTLNLTDCTINSQNCSLSNCEINLKDCLFRSRKDIFKETSLSAHNSTFQGGETEMKGQVKLNDNSIFCFHSSLADPDIFPSKLRIKSKDSQIELKAFSGSFDLNSRNSSFLGKQLRLDKFNSTGDKSSTIKMEVELLEQNSIFVSPNEASYFKVTKLLGAAINVYLRREEKFFKFLLQERAGYSYSPTVICDLPYDLTKHNCYWNREKQGKNRKFVVGAALLLLLLSDDFMRNKQFHFTYFNFKIAQEKMRQQIE